MQGWVSARFGPCCGATSPRRVLRHRVAVPRRGVRQRFCIFVGWLRSACTHAVNISISRQLKSQGFPSVLQRGSARAAGAIKRRIQLIRKGLCQAPSARAASGPPRGCLRASGPRLRSSGPCRPAEGPRGRAEGSRG